MTITPTYTSRRSLISANVVWDNLRRPIAVTRDEVPWGTAGLSAAWLTDVLCTNAPGSKVEDFVLMNRSDGTSSREQLRVLYNDAGKDAGLPEWIHIKSTPSFLTRLAFSHLAATEVNFYARLRPLVKFEAPRSYFTGADLGSGRTMILLEDLAETRDAEFCTWTTKITRVQAEQIVDSLAALHAQFYADPALTPDGYAVRPLEDIYGHGMVKAIDGYHQRALEKMAPHIPARVVENRDLTLELFDRHLEVHRAHPRTLLHSDTHLGNWYKVDSDRRMGLCDWQGVASGHWARDLAYALSTSLTIEDRRAWERELIERYVSRLTEASDIEVTANEAFDLYRHQLFAALAMWTATLVHPEWLPDMQKEEMSMELITRMATAIDDLDAFDE